MRRRIEPLLFRYVIRTGRQVVWAPFLGAVALVEDQPHHEEDDEDGDQACDGDIPGQRMVDV
jgi:hypothetical protein